LVSPENYLFNYMDAQLAETLDKKGHVVQKLLRWQISARSVSLVVLLGLLEFLNVVVSNLLDAVIPSLDSSEE